MLLSTGVENRASLYCEYIAFKIYHFIRMHHQVHLKIFSLFFGVSNKGDLILKDGMVYDLENHKELPGDLHALDVNDSPSEREVSIIEWQREQVKLRGLKLAKLLQEEFAKESQANINQLKSIDLSSPSKTSLSKTKGVKIDFSQKKKERDKKAPDNAHNQKVNEGSQESELDHLNMMESKLEELLQKKMA